MKALIGLSYPEQHQSERCQQVYLPPVCILKLHCNPPSSTTSSSVLLLLTRIPGSTVHHLTLFGALVNGLSVPICAVFTYCIQRQWDCCALLFGPCSGATLSSCSYSLME